MSAILLVGVSMKGGGMWVSKFVRYGKLKDQKTPPPVIILNIDSWNSRNVFYQKWSYKMKVKTWSQDSWQCLSKFTCPEMYMYSVPWSILVFFSPSPLLPLFMHAHQPSPHAAFFTPLFLVPLVPDQFLSCPSTPPGAQCADPTVWVSNPSRHISGGKQQPSQVKILKQRAWATCVAINVSIS